MGDRRVATFFYGSFMDDNILGSEQEFVEAQ